MYICICKAVTEKQIQQHLAEGVNSYQELRERTGVATQCGKCEGCARALWSECHSGGPKIAHLSQELGVGRSIQLVAA